jgi:hypothetical protein
MLPGAVARQGGFAVARHVLLGNLANGPSQIGLIGPSCTTLVNSMNAACAETF